MVQIRKAARQEYKLVFLFARFFPGVARDLAAEVDKDNNDGLVIAIGFRDWSEENSACFL